ncbi:MAG: hypothetical protein KBT28_12825 [Bacteroidales bacterium]|nr:hypothetical protein [Candidatus Colimorpha merdihippi]
MSAYAAKPLVGAYIPEEPVTVYGAAITMHHVTDMRAMLWVKRGDTMYLSTFAIGRPR